MPFNINTGVYTPPAGAENAATGQVIQSAVWNTIHADLSGALTFLAQGGLTWPVQIMAYAHSVNLQVAGDTTLVPIQATTNWVPRGIIVQNVGTVATITGATFGIFTGAGGTGTTVVPSPATITGITATGINVPGAVALLQPANIGSIVLGQTNIFFRVTGTLAVAEAVNVYIQGEQLP